MTISFVTATFIGDPDKYPFTKNHSYVLEIRQKIFGTRLYVSVCHGYEYKHYDGYDHSFYSLHSLLHAWKFEKLEHPFRAQENGFYQTEDPR